MNKICEPVFSHILCSVYQVCETSNIGDDLFPCDLGVNNLIIANHFAISHKNIYFTFKTTTADLLTFTEDIVNENVHLLCNDA